MPETTHDCQQRDVLIKLKNKQCDHDVMMTRLASDVAHIKERLDNGISQTVTKIWDTVNQMHPQVVDNAYWVGRIKSSIVWVACVGIGGGLVALAFHMVRSVFGRSL